MRKVTGNGFFPFSIRSTEENTDEDDGEHRETGNRKMDSVPVTRSLPSNPPGGITALRTSPTAGPATLFLFRARKFCGRCDPAVMTWPS